MTEYFDALLEATAERDFNAVQESTRISHAFAQWVRKNNEEQPVSHFMFVRRKGADKVASVTARELGFPYDDLCVGFLFSDDQSNRGVLFTTADGPRLTHYAVVRYPVSYLEEIDWVWGLDMSILVHELTHYFDKARQTTRSKQPYGLFRAKQTGDHAKDYFNDPLEMNAHFAQAIYAAFKAGASDRGAIDKHLESFDAFYRWIKIDFKDGWVENLSEDNRRKLMLRLHKTYEALRASPDPKLTMYRIVNPK